MKNLTLSDFYNMEIFTREDGSRTPLIDTDKEGHKIGLIGYSAPEGMSDNEIREDAFMYYQQLVEEIK